jgi:CBS domain-containing protein
MYCRDIMKTDVKCVWIDDPARIAAKLMRDEGIGFLPVCDADRRAVGTITDRDLTVRVLAAGLPESTRIGDVMTDEVVSCGPDDDVLIAENLMAKHHKSRIMCTENGRLVGVISLSDIAQHERSYRAVTTLRGVSAREAHA